MVFVFIASRHSLGGIVGGSGSGGGPLLSATFFFGHQEVLGSCNAAVVCDGRRNAAAVDSWDPFLP